MYTVYFQTTAIYLYTFICRHATAQREASAEWSRESTVYKQDYTVHVLQKFSWLTLSEKQEFSPPATRFTYHDVKERKFTKIYAIINRQ